MTPDAWWSEIVTRAFVEGKPEALVAWEERCSALTVAEERAEAAERMLVSSKLEPCMLHPRFQPGCVSCIVKKALEADTLHAQLDKCMEALKLHMEWIGPPPTGPFCFDSLREDAWKEGKAALAQYESVKVIPMKDFEGQLRGLLSRASLDKGWNTPDFMLAEYVILCLAAFHEAVEQRDAWYGGDAAPTSPEGMVVQGGTEGESYGK